MKNMWEEIYASHIDSLKNFYNKACQWMCFSVMSQLIKRCKDLMEFENDCRRK